MTMFHKGDRVRHAQRAEWGEGVVDVAQTVRHNKQQAQRLVIQFQCHGRVTVNTAFAEIVPANGDGASAAAHDANWLSEGADGDRLANLPQAATDPLSTLSRRLTMTLELYRFGDDARGMFDWASARTGLVDPLTRYSRHELEQCFQTFCAKREHSLRQLVGLIKDAGQTELLERAGEHPNAAARQAVQRAVQTGW